MTEPTARAAALAILNRIEREGAYITPVLSDCLARSALDERDRAFCTELVYGTVRMRARLDYLLGRLLKNPSRPLDPGVHNLLRLSLYQLEFLSGVAPYAAVNEAVKLAVALRPGLSGLANAVLRGYLRRRAAISLPGPDEPENYLAVTLSHPRWLARRWLARLGPEEAAALAEADNRPAPVFLRVNTARAGRDDLLARLNDAGRGALPCGLAPEGIRLEDGGSVESLPGYEEGLFMPQDEGAMLVGHAVAPSPGERLIDLCAAPGGKATHLAALGGSDTEITALDSHPGRLGLVEENARRLGFGNLRAAAADAASYRAEEPFDGALLDAPCSGTGVLRRRADLRWRRTPRDLEEIAALQRRLLANAAGLVRPGGRLVYSTCSLEPEENEEQIRWFLREFPAFHPAGLRAHLPPAAAGLCGDDPWLYLWPHRHGTDGFFICRMEKA